MEYQRNKRDPTTIDSGGRGTDLRVPMLSTRALFAALLKSEAEKTRKCVAKVCAGCLEVTFRNGVRFRRAFEKGT